MANPDIIDVTTIQGNNIAITLGGSATTIVNNAAASGKVYKVNTIIASNIDGTNAADITLSLYSQDDLGGSGTPIVSTISVPADSSLILIDKTTSIYVKEDQSIGALAGASGDIAIVASWEEIS